jgi:hypothetical protein
MNRFTKLFLFIIIPIYIFEMICLLIFIINPKLFFYRPWEYFSEISYQFSDIESRWTDIEKSDLTRNNLFYFQDPHKTIVTTDKYGYRSSLYPSNAQIFFAGDSTIFGSGLSDHETLPWIISNKTQIPILNIARTNLINSLNHPSVVNPKVVFDCITERNLKKEFLELSSKNLSKFKPIQENRLNGIVDLIKHTPIQRYSAFYNIIRFFKRIKNDLFYPPKNPNQFIFRNHKMPLNLHLDIIPYIKKRMEYVNSIGSAYFFCPVPAKQTIYGSDISLYTYNFLNYLYTELDRNKIPYVNFTSTFRENKDLGLYRKYDTHWNEKGTNMASNIIIEILKKVQITE